MGNNYFNDYGIKTKIIALFFVAIFGAIVIDTSAKIFAEIYNMGSVLAGYQSLGRYILTLFNGEASFPDPNFSKIPKLKGETFVGLSVHMLVCLFDTYLYFLLSFKILKSKPKILPALIMMWLFMFMPLFMEMPALGLGWAGAESPIKDLLQLRTFICHTCYGISLYAGTILFYKLLKIYKSH
jgi:hypothetical protein